MDLEVLPLIMLRKKALVAKPPKKRRQEPLPAMGDEVKTMELRIREEDTMTRKWVAFVSVLLLSGTVAVAADWNSSFGTVDTDGNGSINRAEFTANEGKLDPTMNPTLTMMDKRATASIRTSGPRRQNRSWPSPRAARRPTNPGARARTILMTRSVRSSLELALDPPALLCNLGASGAGICAGDAAAALP